VGRNSRTIPGVGGSRAYPGNVKGASEGTLGEAPAKFIARDSVMGFIHHPTTSTDTAGIALHERAEVAIGTPLNLFRDAVSTDPKVRTKVRNKARKVTAKSHRKAWFWTARPIPEKKEKNGAAV